MQILKFDDGDPVALENEDAKGPVLLVCEHASRTLPSRFGDMGLTADALESHIAWDPGALAVSRLLMQELDVALIHQRFSRLVYDCNRPPEADAAMPATSEIFPIPGNADISPEERQARAEALYFPFRDAISAFLMGRRKAGRPCVLVTMHSFTPVYHGVAREVEVGILHDTDKRLADLMLKHGEAGPYDIRRNEPYGPADGVTHTLIEHGLKTGRFNVMIEIRNDLIQDEAGQKVMAGYLAGLLLKSIADLAKAQN
ncbi:MAG: N-formylglutamate amidohydrolase [Pararhizobium sp.]|nr:N-formylglutamate amidohydrolase [Pararhizobium sp.]MDO9414608.1 N-formylglutamate amidohydrolase [Pararhizobium sp.]